MANGYSVWKSSIPAGHEIPHYYGDYVRLLFIATAMLSLVALPLWGNLIPFVSIYLQVGAPLLLVLLAGLTSARNLYAMLANATVSGVSALLLEFAAIMYSMSGPHGVELFIAREVAVLLMLCSLYFSIKTIRAMESGKLGRTDSPLEFVDETETAFVPPVERYRSTDISDYDA